MMRFISCNSIQYQDSNALFRCFEHADINWFHLLPMPLEFERMYGQSSSAACQLAEALPTIAMLV